MPSTSIGVYPGSASAVENDEVSSTYLGRHLTFYANDFRAGEHTLITKGHPVVVGEHIVGVALLTEVAGDNNLIPIDTEGIWNLMVYPKDDLGAIDVVAGDELWINKDTSEISKMRNSVTHTRFGYALGGVTTVVGNEVIAVKVHWDGDDELEQVGLTAAQFTSAEADRVFRSYFYEATGGSYITGEVFELTIPNTAARTYVATAKAFKLVTPGDVWIVTGIARTLKVELEVTSGDVNLRTQGVVELAYKNENSVGILNYSSSYLLLRDDSSDLLYGMTRFLTFHDIAAIPDAGAQPHRIFLDTNTGHAMNCAIRCGYGPNAVPFWIMCTTTAPD